MRRTIVLAAFLACAVNGFAAEPPKSANPQLMVMSDGRTMTGDITIQAGGYSIERPGGKLFVPNEQVRCVARDLRDAYRIQRESLTDPSAASLIQLAEWGISYRLYDEARDELHRALRRDPENEVARKMLQRLEEQLLAQPKPRNPNMNSDGIFVQDVETLGGLSKSTAAQFTAKIQPLLINRCGNASCHSAESKSDFRLTHVRIDTRNHRRSAEKNLAVVLKQIDIHDPQQSALLKVTHGPHGQYGATMFGGAQGAEQLRTVQDWVLAVARDRQAEEAKLARQSPLKTKKGRNPPGAEPRRLDDVESATPIAAKNSMVSSDGIVPASFEEPGPTPSETSRKPLPTGMVLRRANDAFDPEAFNQKYGTGAASPPRRLRQE